ncbi:MAG: hypothetical protein V1661_01125 [bacterium]
MSFEKISVGLENLIEDEDKYDPHFEGVNFNEIRPMDMDIYLQVAELRKKTAGEGGAILQEQIELLSQAVKQLAKDVNKGEESRKNFLGLVANKLGVISGKLEAKEKGVEPQEPRGMDFLEENDKKNHHFKLMLEQDKNAFEKISEEEKNLYHKTVKLRNEVFEDQFVDDEVVEDIKAALAELKQLKEKSKENLFLEFIANQLSAIKIEAENILEDEK